MQLKIENTDTEILFNLHQIELKSGVRLSQANKLLYIKLLHLCSEKGHYDPELNKFFIQLSVKNIAAETSMIQRTVQVSLNKLVESGVIKKIDDTDESSSYHQKLTKKIYFEHEIFKADWKLKGVE